MTDEELKQLVASLAVGQRELTEQQKKTDGQMRYISEQQKKTDELLRYNAEQQKKTDELLRYNAAQQKKTDEQMRHTDEQFKRTDEKLKSIGIQLGNMSKNQGDIAEEFFFNSLVKDTRLGEIHFEDITKNMQKHRANIQEEYDLVMTNGEAIGIVEVKYKAHENDLHKLERKMRHFKQLFPIYSNYKLYGAIASFHINDDAKLEALNRGFFVLQRTGKLLHTDCAKQLLIL